MVRRSFAAFVFCLALSAAAGPLFGQTDEVTELKQDVDQETRELSELRVRARGILKEIEGLEKSVVRLRNETFAIREKLFEGKKKIRALGRKMARTEAEIDRFRQRMGRRLVAVYKFSRPGAVSLLLGAEGPAHGLKMVTYLKRLAQYDDSLAQEWVALLDQYGEDRDRLIKGQERLAMLEGEARAKEASSRKAKSQKIALLREIHAKESLYLAHLDELKESLEELRTKIQEKQRSKGNGLQGLEGQLEQPVPGRVIRGFGLKRHPKFGTKVRSDGIYIRPAKSLKVQPVIFGRVAYAGYIPGLSQVVIVDHGQGYFSIYGGLEVLYTIEGQQVFRNTVLGTLPEESPRDLYFEIRHHDRPLNPTKWLRLSKK